MPTWLQQNGGLMLVIVGAASGLTLIAAMIVSELDQPGFRWRTAIVHLLGTFAGAALFVYCLFLLMQVAIARLITSIPERFGSGG